MYLWRFRAGRGNGGAGRGTADTWEQEHQRPTKVSVATRWLAILLLLEAAPVDAQLPDLVVHDAPGRVQQARRLRAVAPRGLERVLDETFSYASIASFNDRLIAVPDDTAVCSVGGR